MKIEIPHPDEIDQVGTQIVIHKWDTWSMDHTLAYIIVPMLKQLKETKHGAPAVEFKDVPQELLPPDVEAFNKLYAQNGETDENFFKRWDYVLDEMIWAFEQKLIDWEDQYSSGEVDRISVPIDKDGNEVPEEDAEFHRWDKGPNDTYEVDWEGRKVHQDRMTNGFRLFGKYYESLWD